MRVRNRWFKEGKEHTPQELAGAIALTAWRIAEHMLKNLRRADFDIAVGPQYFAFLAESLIFVVQIADRIAFSHMAEEAREHFTTELANRVADNLAENQQRLLGDDLAAARSAFINRLNRRASDYAEYEFDATGENFSLLRYFAYAVSELLDEKDRHWVSDQIIAIEAPDAIAAVDKAMRGLLGQEPRARRFPSAAGGD